MTKEIEIRLVVPANSMRWLLTAALMLACVSDTVSESVSLTTYYPAPSGIYTQMITTNNTFLARDGGNVTIGGNSGAAANKLSVNAGGVSGTYGLTPGYANWAAYGVGSGGAAIYNDANVYRKLMVVGNNSAGGSREVGVWDNMTVNGNDTVTGNQSVGGNGQVSGNMGVGGAYADARLRVVGNVHVGGWNNGGVGATARGYIYVDNGSTACTATTAPVDTTICAAGQYATFNPGIYTEGYTYSNRGGQVLAVKGGYNTTQVLGLNPGVQMGGYPKDVDWLTLNKDDQGVTYYCCLK